MDIEPISNGKHLSAPSPPSFDNIISITFSSSGLLLAAECYSFQQHFGERNINNDGINMKKTSWLENKDSKRQNWPLSRAAQLNFSYKEPEKHKSIKLMWLFLFLFFT